LELPSRYWVGVFLFAWNGVEMAGVIPITQHGNGVSSVGLVKIRNNDALLSEQKEREEAARKAEGRHLMIVSHLSSHIKRCWQRAKQAKIPIENQMLKSLRQRYGVYESDKLAAIRKMGGSDVYVMLTATKCRACEAWIMDVMRPVSDRPWTVKPTPIADLPPAVEMSIKQDAQFLVREVASQVQALGQVVNLDDIREEVRQFLAKSKDDALKKVQREAEKRAERMSTKIEDQMTEGGWSSAFAGIVSDLVTMPSAILKGPVVRRKKRMKWVMDNSTGKWRVKASYALTPEFYRVSPLDFYPAPGIRNVNDGDICERHRLKRNDLVAMLGVPGYNDEHIRGALNAYANGSPREHLPIDSQRAQIEHRSQDFLLSSSSGDIEAIEYWGSVPGRYLIEWGMSGGDIDPEMEYEINAWLVGDYTIKAVLNPDQLGRKPYSVDSFERVPGAIWGHGIPELMSDIQDVCNALARAIVNNAGLASGPQVEVNKSRVRDSEEFWPWRIWEAENDQMSEAPALRFYQPRIIVDPLLKVFNSFSLMADDQTGVPRWSHGNTNIGGAGDTSSGLSMLMTSAARGVKEVISHIDNMISGAVTRAYDYNMMYDDDDSIKGDLRIRAKGSSSLMAKEQRMLRTNELLRSTNNPTDMQIVGLKGRAALLREALRLAEVDDIEIVPDDEALKNLEAQLIKKEQQLLASGQNPASILGAGVAPEEIPQELDNAGNPAGGTGANMFQNQPGAAA